MKESCHGNLLWTPESHRTTVHELYSQNELGPHAVIAHLLGFSEAS